MQKKIEYEIHTFLYQNKNQIFKKLEEDYNLPYGKVYELYYIEDLSVKQISQRLNYSESYIRQLLHNIDMVCYGMMFK